MDIEQFRGKSVDDLKAHLIELRKEQFSMRMQLAMGQFQRLMKSVECAVILLV